MIFENRVITPIPQLLVVTMGALKSQASSDQGIDIYPSSKCRKHAAFTLTSSDAVYCISHLPVKSLVVNFQYRHTAFYSPTLKQYFTSKQRSFLTKMWLSPYKHFFWFMKAMLFPQHLKRETFKWSSYFRSQNVNSLGLVFEYRGKFKAKGGCLHLSHVQQATGKGSLNSRL